MPTLRLRSRYVQVLFQHIIYISCPTRKLPAQHRSTTFRSQIMNIFDLPTNFNSDKQTPLQQHPWIPTSPKPLHPLRQSTSGNLTSPTASSASGTSPPLTDPSTGIKFNCCEQYMMYHSRRPLQHRFRPRSSRRQPTRCSQTNQLRPTHDVQRRRLVYRSPPQVSLIFLLPFPHVIPQTNR